MCFSATASFGAAAITGAAGVGALSRVHSPREFPLAAMPVLFAVQQASEGLLWLNLANAPDGAFVQALVGIFTVIALVVWPVWVPLAVGMIEPQRIRRVMIYGLLLLGAVAAFYSALDIGRHPYAASLSAASICYTNRVAFPDPILMLYVLGTCIPSFLSSHSAVRVFGGFTAAGLLLSTLFYNVSLISVWCFFAALASVAIFALFQNRAALAFNSPVRA